MDTLTDEMKLIWVLATIEDFEVENPSEEKLVCSCQLFLRDYMLMNDPDSPDKPTKMLIVDIWNEIIENARAFSIDIVKKFPSLVTA